MGLPSTLKIRKKFYSRHHELVDSTQLTNDLSCFRSFALLRIRVLTDSDNYFSQICALGQFDFFYEIAIAREGL
jgi:hypothetical protein